MQVVPSDAILWARQFTDDAVGGEIMEWAGTGSTWTRMFHVFVVPVEDGDDRVRLGDWVLKDGENKLRVVSDAAFQAHYRVLADG